MLTTGSVLITGGAGQLGSELAALLTGKVQVLAPTRAELDITDDEAVSRVFERHRPELVFNCAAFHLVDLCEREEDRSFEVNARAVKRLAEQCAPSNAKLVHLSTNYVFRGDRPEPYGERDLPSPQSVYAMSKLAGEHAALTYAPGALVVRTAGLYGAPARGSTRRNFVERILATAREQGSLEVVDDQRLSPTFTADLAAALLEAVGRGVEGVLHLTSSGACSWHEFATAIVQHAGLDVQVAPVRTTVSPGHARRPRNGVLGRAAADAAGLAPLPPWHDALERYAQAAGLGSGQRDRPATA